MTESKRWVILQHEGAPHDIEGIHFDFLLEEFLFCRTWRLNRIPTKEDPEVNATRLPDHSLRWLDVQESTLSRGRGYVTRVDRGIYKGSVPHQEGDFFQIEILGKGLSGSLKIGPTSIRMLE